MLYQISGNRTLQRFQNLLLPVFGYVHDKALLTERDPDRPFVGHRGLVDVLRSGDPDAFRQAMRLHLDNHFQSVFGNHVSLDGASREESSNAG